jgi:transposase-like protein
MRSMNAYSEDLRKKVVEALQRGATKTEAARAFGVSQLLRKALRQAGRAGTPAHPEETTRLQAEDGRTRQEAFGGGPPRTPRGHPLRAARVPGKGGRPAGQRVQREQDAKAFGSQPKKDRWELESRERAEFLRAARRALLAGELDVDKLVFVD